MKRNDPDELFWSAVRVGHKDECWPFLMGTNDYGYGILRWRGKSDLAHRVAYAIGVRSPEGKCVLHHCDNPPCCNPDHLFLGTRRDNVDDRHQKKRDNAPRGETHHDAVLGAMDVLAIRASRAKGLDLAREYKVTPQQISRIRHRHTWRHI